MLPILQIGPLAIQLPGLLVLAGIWLGTNMIEKQAARLRLSVTTIQNMVLLGLVTGVVGARLGYAVRYLDVYLEDPIGLISLQPATLSPEFGILVGLITCWVYGQRRQLAFWRTRWRRAWPYSVYSSGCPIWRAAMPSARPRVFPGRSSSGVRCAIRRKSTRFLWPDSFCSPSSRRDGMNRSLGSAFCFGLPWLRAPDWCSRHSGATAC